MNYSLYNHVGKLIIKDKQNEHNMFILNSDILNISQYYYNLDDNLIYTITQTNDNFKVEYVLYDHLVNLNKSKIDEEIKKFKYFNHKR